MKQHGYGGSGSTIDGSNHTGDQSRWEVWERSAWESGLGLISVWMYRYEPVLYKDKMKPI